MKFPKKLNKGDTVGLVCPSSAVSSERVQQCADTIKKLGYIPKLSENLDWSYKGLMAGKGKDRAELLNNMFADPEVDAIFCVRGGDGSSRIMEYLDYDIIRKNPKIFVGYSDITNLHIGLTQNCDFVTFHGPMVSSNMGKEYPVHLRLTLQMNRRHLHSNKDNAKISEPLSAFFRDHRIFRIIAFLLPLRRPARLNDHPLVFFYFCLMALQNFNGYLRSWSTFRRTVDYQRISDKSRRVHLLHGDRGNMAAFMMLI